MNLFEGKIEAQKIDEYINTITNVEKAGELLIVLVGDNPASVNYIRIKMKLCEKLGIKVRYEHLSENLSDDEIFQKIETAFSDKKVSGGIIQLPLPRESLKKSLEFIPPYKDVDLISGKSIEQLYSSDFTRLTPVIRAFNYFLLTAVNGEAQNIEDYINIQTSTALIKEKAAWLKGTIIGNGFLVGKPLYHYLTSLGISININTNYTTGDKIYSDFLILGTGVPRLVVGSDISTGCHVIDFGTAVIDGKVVGDLDKNSEISHLGLVSFSPGGIGPVVVRFLILNFLQI